MKKLTFFLILVRCLIAQTSPCDLNGDVLVNVADVQMAINQALGVSACTADLDSDGECDIVEVQRVINAALGMGCNSGSGASVDESKETLFVYVDATHGSDSNPGTPSSPFRTLSKGVNTAIAKSKSGIG